MCLYQKNLEYFSVCSHLVKMINIQIVHSMEICRIPMYIYNPII